MSSWSQLLLKYYRFSDTLRWRGTWVSLVITLHFLLLICRFDSTDVGAVAGHLFTGSAAMMAIEVAGFAAIISLLTPKVMECLAPRRLDESNAVVKLLVPYLIGSFAWVGTVLVLGCVLLSVHGGVSILWLRAMLAVGIFLFIFCMISNLKLLGVLFEVIDITSRFVARTSDDSTESDAWPT